MTCFIHIAGMETRSNSLALLLHRAKNTETAQDTDVQEGFSMSMQFVLLDNSELGALIPMLIIQLF